MWVLLPFLLPSLATAIISLEVTPTTFFCGDTVTLTYSATGDQTNPLTVYLKGQLSLYSSASSILPDTPLDGQSYTATWQPSGCDASGTWFFFIQDYYGTSSNSAYVTIAPYGSSGFIGVPQASPATLSAGERVSVAFDSYGDTDPVSAYVVSYASSGNSYLGQWTTYPLLSVSTSPGTISGVIPAAGVSTGSYFIFLRSGSGEWSEGAPITVTKTLPLCSPSTFRAYDLITVSWPADGVTYPVDVLIVGQQINDRGANAGDVMAVLLGTVASGTSLTAQVTLAHVSEGNYYVYLRYASSTTIYSQLIPVTAQAYDTNPVAQFSPADAFVALRWAFLAYLEGNALLAWNTSNVCSSCPACAQVSSVTSIQYIEADKNGAAFLLRTSDNIVVLSFRGTNSLSDGILDFDAIRMEYLGCGEVPASTCYLHTGFYTIYTNLLKYLVPALHNEIPAAQRAITPIVITGHSLGGALATIAAYELSLAGYLVRGVFTFGSPRVGNLVSSCFLIYPTTSMLYFTMSFPPYSPFITTHAGFHSCI